LIGLSNARDRSVDRRAVLDESACVAAALAATHGRGVPRVRFPFHDDFRFPTRARDACVGRAKAPDVKRFVTCFAFAATLGFAGCKDVPTSPTTTSSFVRPASDIVIKSVRTVAPGDEIAGAANYEYYIVKFTYTNDLGYAFTPVISHFGLEDVDRRRFKGEDSGSTALVGITNYAEQLKVGDSHDYTVGFHVPENTYGVLSYDPTAE
jgi:hypothetical protein